MVMNSIKLDVEMERKIVDITQTESKKIEFQLEYKNRFENKITKPHEHHQ